MRGRNYSQRIIVVAFALLMLGGGAQAAERPKHSWELDVPRYASAHWKWRDQWSIEFTPYQADLMQELIEDATAPIPLFHYERDMSKWPPIIHDLIMREEVTPYQALSLLWWYRSGSGGHSPQLTDESQRVLVQLRDEDLSAEWAMLAGMKSVSYGSRRWGDSPPDLSILGKEYFNRARELDPAWDMPYYYLIGMVWRDAMSKLPRGVNSQSPYAKLQPYLWPSAGTVKHEAHQLMREYMGATDYSSLLTPPWATRVEPYSQRGRAYFGIPYEVYGYADWAVSDLLWLLIDMSIEERSADDLAFVLDFFAASLVHADGFYRRGLVDFMEKLPRELEHRILDGEVMREIRRASPALRDAANNDLPGGEYRKLYPNGEVSYGVAETQDSIRQVEENAIKPLQRAAARLRELGPSAFAPKGYKETVQAVHGELRKASIAAWPLSEESQRYLELLPPQVELTPQGKVAVSYLLGYLLSPDEQTRSACEGAWRRRCDAIYTEQGAGFEQRATVAIWKGTPERDREVVDEYEAMSESDRPQSAEWSLTMWQLAMRADGVGGKTEEERAIREKYRNFSYRYAEEAAQHSPEWVLSQILQLEVKYERAIVRASGMYVLEGGSFPSVTDPYPYVSDEDAAAICAQMQAVNQALDLHRMLPIPWGVRIDLDDVTGEITYLSSLSDYLKIPTVDRYNSFTNSSRYNAARFVAWHGARTRNPQGIVVALQYLQKQMLLDPSNLGHPGFLKIVLPEIMGYITQRLEECEVQELLAGPIQQAARECELVRRMHQWKTKELALDKQQKASASEALDRRYEQMRKELWQLLDDAIEIVLSLEPDDFVQPRGG